MPHESRELELEIRRPRREPLRDVIEEGTYSIGSDADNNIALPDPSVSARHAILVVRSDSWWIEDLNTPPATRVDGEPVEGRAALQSGQDVEIGPYVLTLSRRPAPGADDGTAAASQPAPPSEPAKTETPAESPPAMDPQLARRQSVKQQIHAELINRMDLKRLIAAQIEEDELHERALVQIRDIVADVRSRLPAGIDPEGLVKEVYDEAVGLGPLEDLIDDPSITEIMVNGHAGIYIEKDGRIERTNRAFLNDDSVLAIIERIVSPIGRRIDESQPYVDARLKDGSRVNAIIAPLSLVGPCITIRKFSKRPFTTEDLIRFGTLEESMAEFLRVCVELHKSIIVSGGTGTGKTTLLNVLSSYLPVTERIITIEDAAELRLGQEHVVRLEARPPNIEGRGAISIRDLVRNALRMRPDRIVVGECRGGEALDMLQAMNTGHEGSLTTVHANTPRDVISRLETMVLMAGMELPVRAIREQIASAVDLIVQIARLKDGTRRVVKITEVAGLEGDRITMQDLFVFTQTGLDADGRVQGEFAPTGAVPLFVEEIRSQGIRFDQGIFDPQRRPGRASPGADEALQ